MSHFRQAAALAAPSVILVFLVVVLFAVACKDAFNDEVADPETGVAYFDTMRHSLTTCFRILVGEWHDTMFEAVAETTEATQLWFYGISFILSVLMAELIIGVSIYNYTHAWCAYIALSWVGLSLQVIMSMYAKVGEIQNRRLSEVLAPIFEFRSAESETLLEATLELCRKTRVYNEIFLQINDECEQSTHPVVQPRHASGHAEPMPRFGQSPAISA